MAVGKRRLAGRVGGLGKGRFLGVEGSMTLDDQSLVSRLTELLARERELRADFIAHLAEFDRRRLYLVAGFPSLFAWLTDGMRMSNASAFRRVTAARLVTSVPAVLAVLRDGRVSLNKVCALRDVLTGDNGDELLARAAAMSEREVEELAASMSRKPEPRSPRDSIRIIPPPAPLPSAEPDLFAPRALASAAEAVRVETAQPVRRLITMSVGPEFVRLLDEVRAALSHSHPCASLEALFAACMRLTLAHKALTVRAEVARPRAQRSASDGRYVPAEIRRAVWTRDGARCSFVADDGRRCSATRRLQLHHRVPFARGGPATAENLTVVCAQHNDLAARQDYGDAHMDAFTGAGLSPAP